MSPARLTASLALAAAISAVAVEASARPIRPRVAACKPIDYMDWNDVPTRGSGNEQLRRTVELWYDLFTQPEDDTRSRAEVVADTHRIEVCVANKGAIRCPGHGTTDEPWVLYDDSASPPVMRLSTNPPISTLEELAERLLPSTGVGARFGTELLPPDPRNDWDDPTTAGNFYVLRVNSEPLGYSTTEAGNFAPALVVEGGFCALPRRLAASRDGHFLAYGVEAQPPWPFPGPMPLVCRDPRRCVAQDPCVDGAKAIGPGGAPYHARSHCVNPSHARFIVDRASEIDSWQREVAVARAAPEPPAWANGSDGGACPSPAPEGHCPSRIFLSPIEAGGQGTNGGIALNTSMFPPSPLSPLTGEASAIVNLTAHELGHKLQDAYIHQSVRELGVDPPGFHTVGVSEAVPTAIQAHLCVEGYGGVTTRKCVSQGMLGQQGSAAHLWLDSPSADLLDLPYTTAVVWRYVMEQFAIPISPGAASPHPSGRSSRFESDRSLPLGDPSRRSDEGADLLGPLLRAIASRPGEPPFEGAFNSVLLDHLGRDLENVLLDLHTTMLLKDYRDADPRWSIDWIGDMNAGAKGPIAPGWPIPGPPMNTLKPFVVPTDLRAAGPDLLPRARRELDSHEPCPPRGRCAAAPPRYLPSDGGFASGAPSLVHGHGAAYLSATPSPGQAGVTLRVMPVGDAPLRLRVFTVDRAGNPTLLQGCRESVSGPLPAPQQQCRPRAEGDFVVDVPVTGDVAEVLAVVSNTKPTDAMFGWRVGKAKASLTLLEPTRAATLDVGHPSAGRRPFRVELSSRDERNEPARVRLDTVELRVPGCGDDKGCVVPRDDYRVVEVSRGTVWLVGTLPEALYPRAGASLGIDVRLTTAAGERLGASSEAALTARAVAPKVVAALVLDRSGSMDDGDGAKLVATKTAAKAALAGLRDGDELALVTFNHDAQTISPVRRLDAVSRPELAAAIDGVRALGWTSIGDGALEASSALVAAGYDERSDHDPALAMLVLSDGRSNAGYEPERYTLHPPYAGYSDGTALPPGAFDLEDLGPDNLPWPTGTSGLLGWTTRSNFRGPNGATYLVPRVSTVAIGQDSDAGPLRKMADVCRGTFSYADGLTRADELRAAVTQVGDAVLGGLAAATGRDRLFARTVGSLASLELPALPPGTRDVVVTILSHAGGLAHVSVEDARGRRARPASLAPHHAVFKLDGAVSGALRLADVSDVRGPVLVEVTARAPGAMFAHLDVDDVPAPPTDGRSPFEPARHAGKPVRVSAALVDEGPVRGAVVLATVVAPDGARRELALLDDGVHGDGAPNDGVYAATLDATDAPGVYRFELDARARAERPFARAAHLAIALDAPPDRDRDGLPDAWERRHGTDPSRDDARDDPDGDGLDNATERRLGTLPLRGDSDGGGESDGSEAARGRSPVTPGDDGARALPTRVVARSASIGVGSPVSAAPGLALEVRRVTSAGSHAPLSCHPLKTSDGSLAVECAARPRERVCVSARTRDAATGAASAWSSPGCVRPSSDTDAPRVEAVSLERDAAGGRATLRVDASDRSHQRDPLRDPALSPSGLAAVRVDVGATAGAWTPYRREQRIRLPASDTALTVRVRDRAGNVSAPTTLRARVAR